MSRPVAPIECQVVLIQDLSGAFLGTKTKNPVYVGLVPKIELPDQRILAKEIQELRQQSTPRRSLPSFSEAFKKYGGPLSPIPEVLKRKNNNRKSIIDTHVVGKQNKIADGREIISSTSTSTEILRTKVRDFEQRSMSSPISMPVDPNELSTTIDPNEEIFQDGQKQEIESTSNENVDESTVTDQELLNESETFDIGEKNSSKC